MLLSELFSGQTPSTKKSSDGTVAEVFIIESLTLGDETKQRHEGAVLASILRMCGKKPMYYYIRTKAELVHLVDEFDASGYRYLHLSCHGNDTSLDTTLDSISYSEFARIFEDRLKGRRLTCGVEDRPRPHRTQSRAILSSFSPPNTWANLLPA